MCAKRGFWPSVTLFAVCLVAVAAGPTVAQIGPLTIPLDSLAEIWDTTTVKPIRESVWKDLNDYLRNDRYWLSTHPTDPTIDCAAVKRNTLAAMAGKGSGGDNWFEGVDTVTGGVWGEHYPTWHETILTRISHTHKKHRSPGDVKFMYGMNLTRFPTEDRCPHTVSPFPWHFKGARGAG